MQNGLNSTVQSTGTYQLTTIMQLILKAMCFHLSKLGLWNFC